MDGIYHLSRHAQRRADLALHTLQVKQHYVERKFIAHTVVLNCSITKLKNNSVTLQSEKQIIVENKTKMVTKVCCRRIH